MSHTAATLADMGRSGGGVSRYVYRGRVRYRARAHVNGESVSLGIYDSAEEAQAVVDAAHEQLGTTIEIPGTKRVLDYGRTWLKEREEAGRIRGIRQEKSLWRTHVESAPFVTLPLKLVTRAQVFAWATKLCDTRSRQTAKHALRLLRTCLQSAQDAGLIDTNPARGVKLPTGLGHEEDAAPKWTWLRQSEIDALLTSRAVPQWARDIWAVAIYTGLRKGELAGLRWSDVHLDGERSHLAVLRSYRGTTKSGKGREVPLLPPAADALRRQRARRPGIGDRPVWPSPSDGVWAPNSWDPGGWRRYALGATRPDSGGELDRHVRFHDLRHTCASHLVQGTWLAAPMDLYRVKAWLGHSSLSVTQRYAHLAPGNLHDLATTWRPATTGKPANGED